MILLIDPGCDIDIINNSIKVFRAMSVEKMDIRFDKARIRAYKTAQAQKTEY